MGDLCRSDTHQVEYGGSGNAELLGGDPARGALVPVIGLRLAGLRQAKRQAKEKGVYPFHAHKNTLPKGRREYRSLVNLQGKKYWISGIRKDTRINYLFGPMIPLRQFHVAAVLTLLLMTGFREARCQYDHEIDSLQRLLARSKEDTSRAGLLIRLAYYFGDFDTRKALQYEKEGYALSRKLGYSPGMARAAYQLSQVYMSMGDYPLSDSFLTEAEHY